jgi:GDP-mannose transporter
MQVATLLADHNSLLQEYSNVETVIVFQTLTSLAVAYGDFKMLNSGMPSGKIILSLFIIVLGAVLYILTDSTFRVEAYFWVMLYFVAKVADTLYISK